MLGIRTKGDLIQAVLLNEALHPGSIELYPVGSSYGWAIGGAKLWLEMETVYRTPGHHVGFIVGKAQLEKLIADRAYQQGSKFRLQNFMDEYSVDLW